MATARGRSEASAYIGRIPEQLVRVLRGAARTGGRVIADEAKLRSASDEVADAVVIRARSEDHRVVVRVTVKAGWTYSRAVWLEYGTEPHFISVDERQRGGLGVRQINSKFREADGNGSMVINGKFVGGTVFHPGATPHPFLRPALDTKRTEAIQAAQKYIDARVSRGGIVGTDEGDGE